MGQYHFGHVTRTMDKQQPIARRNTTAELQKPMQITVSHARFNISYCQLQA